ncbi:MAG: DUF2891 family protein [Planctomycetota bacterium]
MRTLLAAAVVLSGLCLSARSEEPEVKPPTLDSVCDAMAPIIAKGIAEKDTAAPVFHGNIDWHSAVHGHWALFRIARATGRHGEEARLADESLEPGLILKEMALLKDDPLGELPYGFAWFLLLAEEFEQWSTELKGKDPKRLRAMADAAAAALVAHYRRKGPSPLTREYENASWAMVRLHSWFSFAQDKEALAAVNAWIAGMKGLEKPANGFVFDRSHSDFFSRFGNFAYLTAKTREPADLSAFMALRPIFDEDIAPLVNTDDTAHHLGTNWSRAWALKALAATAPEEADRKRFRKAFEAHVVQGMKQHEESKGDYWAYGHWVPQFAVYAVTDGDDEKK